VIKVLFCGATPSTCPERRLFGRHWRWNPQRQLRLSTSFSVALAVSPPIILRSLARLQAGELALAHITWRLAGGSRIHAPF
jgi:hypothetical protein